MGFVTVNILDLLNIDGGEKLEKILSSFSCPLNKEIEEFIINDAIIFAQKKIAITHLIFDDVDYKLLGFYTLTNKVIEICPDGLSNKLKKRLARYFKEDENGNFVGPCYLIAQLSKNLNYSLNNISGDDILTDALEKIQLAQRNVGGGFVYVECEDNAKLLDFYGRSQFAYIGQRNSQENILYKILLRKI